MFVLAYIDISIFSGNPFLAHSLELSYHQTQPFKQEKYNTKSKICVKITEKKNIEQATTSKNNLLGSNALLGPSKWEKRAVCRDPTPSVTPSVSDTDLNFPFANDSTEEEEQDADCVFCTGRFSKTTMWKSGYDVRNISDGVTHCVSTEEDFVCEPRQGHTLCCFSIVFAIF